MSSLRFAESHIARRRRVYGDPCQAQRWRPLRGRGGSCWHALRQGVQFFSLGVQSGVKQHMKNRHTNYLLMHLIIHLSSHHHHRSNRPMGKTDSPRCRHPRAHQLRQKRRGSLGGTIRGYTTYKSPRDKSHKVMHHAITFPPGMPPIPSAQLPDNEVDYEVDSEVDY